MFGSIQLSCECFCFYRCNNFLLHYVFLIFLLFFSFFSLSFAACVCAPSPDCIQTEYDCTDAYSSCVSYSANHIACGNSCGCTIKNGFVRGNSYGIWDCPGSEWKKCIDGYDRVIYIEASKSCESLGDICVGGDSCPPGMEPKMKWQIEICGSSVSDCPPSHLVQADPLECVPKSQNDSEKVGGYTDSEGNTSKCPAGYGTFENIQSGIDGAIACILSGTSPDDIPYGTGNIAPDVPFEGTNDVKKSDSVPPSGLECENIREYTWGDIRYRCCINLDNSDCQYIDPPPSPPQENDGNEGTDNKLLSDITAKLDANNSRISQSNSILQSIRNGTRITNSKLGSIESKVSESNSKLGSIESKVSETNAKLDAVKDSVDDLVEHPSSPNVDADVSGVLNQIPLSTLPSGDWDVSSITSQLLPPSGGVCPNFEIEFSFLNQNVDMTPQYFCITLDIIRTFFYVFMLVVSFRIVLSD